MSYDASRMEHLGEQIKKAREDADVTQIELGIAVGVTRSTIYRWEIGQSDPSMRQVQAIAIVTGKPMTFFINGEDYE